MNPKIAFLTTIFPTKNEYLVDFFDSLEQQTFKNFDVIVLNDGYENFEAILQKYPNLKIIELPYKNTPAKNREYGINFVKENNYDILIFGDSDDYFEKNRIEKSIELLNAYDIVVNDVSLFNQDGIYNKKYFSNRIRNHSEINLDFIKEKNIFGLSNTALATNILDKIEFDDDLIAVDWYLFSFLLLKNKKAIFTNETQTFYRQYSNNTIGLSKITQEDINTIIKVKMKHYELMKKLHLSYNDLYTRMEDFVHYSENEVIKNPLWWEFQKNQED